MDYLNYETNTNSNVIQIPVKFKEPLKGFVEKTPITDSMMTVSHSLDKVSAYKSKIEWEPFKKLEIRTSKNSVRGGMIFKSPFKLVNTHPTCQQCLYSFEVDTYGRGCVHNCVYCYAKDTLTQKGMWNNPYPVPTDINIIRKTFYTVFETDKKSKWRDILEKRIPLRIGSMSDSFMLMDKKFGVTKELLSILKFYKYPYVIFTRSDLIAQEEYLNVLDKDICSVQISISSINDVLNKQIEPGAPSTERRLKALRRLNDAGFWTTVRINPLFPMRPDGYFSNPDFEWWGDGPVPSFDYSSFDMIESIAATGTPSVLAGFGRLSPIGLNQIFKATGVSLKPFFNPDKSLRKSKKDYHFSDAEVRFYYEKLKEKCIENAIEFSTCYIGNGENHFWKDQDLWSNKFDCCNIKGKVEGFKTDSREIKFEDRLKFTSNKDLLPVSNDLHKPLSNESNKKVLKKIKEVDYEATT